MSMMVERFEDMSRDGLLRLFKQDDGDVVIAVIEDDEPTRRGRVGSIEFCTSGGGSRRTLAALVALMGAMAEDNLDSNNVSKRPLFQEDDELKKIIDWSKGSANARKEVDAYHREMHGSMNRKAEFFEKMSGLLEEYRVELVATDDDKSYGMHSGLIQVEFQLPDYSEHTMVALTASDAKELAQKFRDQDQKT